VSPSRIAILATALALPFAAGCQAVSTTAPSPHAGPMVGVHASVETDPVPSAGDAADDPAIWIDHRRADRSVVIGTDKAGGLAVYALDGSQLQFDDTVTPNNVDVRSGFRLGDRRVPLVAFGDVGDGEIGVYTIDARTRTVRDISTGAIEPGVSPVGFCLYHSEATGRFYAFVVDDADGSVEQWRLFDDGTGAVDGALVRTFATGSNSEGCVADDRYARFYVSEQSVGIWRYGAEPDDGENAVLVDAVGDTGHLTEDVEGLAIYEASHGRGYLIASSQGADDFQVYRRASGRYVGTFDVEDGAAVDGVSNTDGIEVTNVGLAPPFGSGMFVAQDGDNPGANQDFKLVTWRRIARAFDPPLLIEREV
jgi:3-phytase